MLQTERFNPKPGNPYRVIAVQDAEHHANLRVTIAMSGGIASDQHILTVLGKTAQELGGIRPGDELIFGEHAALERVERCNEATACAGTSASYELEERARHRHDLERMSMSALAEAVAVNPDHAKETGEAMRAAIDALLGTTKEKA